MSSMNTIWLFVTALLVIFQFDFVISSHFSNFRNGPDDSNSTQKLGISSLVA